MADFDGIISTSPQWVDIPSLSTSAIALGGTAGAGAMNAQAVALAKRTNYLINYSVQISPTTGNAGIGTSSALGRLQIGDYSVDVNNKIVLGKAQASTEGNLPAIGQKSTGVGNDLALASTSASGSVKIFTGTSTNSGEIGTGSNTEKLKIDNSGWVYANGATSRFVVSPSTPTNNAIFHAQNSSGSAYFGIDNSAGGFTGIAYSLGIWHTGAYPIILGTNNTIRMTIDSTGILNKFVSSSSGAETVAIRFTNGTNNLGSIRSYNSSGLDQHIRLYASAAGTEFLAASIDHQGNFGQGLTPSTNWASGHKAHEIGYSGNYIMSRQSNEINVGAGNTYGKYAVSGAPVSMYSQVSGAHYWNNAASGTIGNTITWSPAMTLTTSGALLVGSSSQVTSEKVHINATQAGGQPIALRLYNAGTTGGTGSTLNFTTMSYSGAVVNVGSIAGIASDTVGGGVLTFGVPKAGVSSEIARIDPAGLLVGTTNSGYSSSGRGLIELNGSTDSVIGLRVGGNNRAFFQATNGNDLIISNQTATGSTSFYMSSSPKVTIISTGFVGMGTTSPSEIIHAKGSATDVSVRLENTTSGTKVWNLTSGGGTTISTGSFAIRNVTDSTTPLQIGNGDKVGLGINPNTSGTENSGRLILSSDANSGVFFGNTANAAKNVLDWYEEGTFTPLVFGGTTPGTGTYAYNTGMYTRIGSLLFIKMKIGYTVHTGTGELWIGIPYTTGSSPPPALSNSSFANGSVPVLMNPALSGYCTYSMAATIGSGGYAMYNISRQNLSSGAIDTFSISDCTNKVMNISGVLSL